MPEAPEYKIMEESVGPIVKEMEVTHIKTLGKPFKKPDKQANHVARVNKIPVPFVIKKLHHRGKEFNLEADKNLSLRISFCQGAYLYVIDDLNLLETKPFSNNAFLGFFGKINNKDACLLIMDVSIFRHQATVHVFDDGKLHWSNEETVSKPLISIGKQYNNSTIQSVVHNKLRGPCMLNQHNLFKEKFLEKWNDKEDRKYFFCHSLAYIMFDDSLMWGYGDYTVSEVLCRLHYAHNVKPWDIAGEVFENKPEFLDAFLNAPQTLLDEHKLYWKDYDPALFRRPQQKARAEFRLKFLQVYGQDWHQDRPVYTFAVITNRGKQSLWTFCFESNAEVPDAIETKSGPLGNKDKDSLLSVSSDLKKEGWYRYDGRELSKGTIGVGPHDWHLPEKAERYPINIDIRINCPKTKRFSKEKQKRADEDEADTDSPKKKNSKKRPIKDVDKAPKKKKAKKSIPSEVSVENEMDCNDAPPPPPPLPPRPPKKKKKISKKNQEKRRQWVLKQNREEKKKVLMQIKDDCRYGRLYVV